MKKVLFGSLFLLLLSTAVHAATVTNTISWTTAPANVESYTVEKSAALTGPWTALLMLPGTVLSFQDAGNAPGINTCYRVTPANTLPSTGAPASKCSMIIGPVGNMGEIFISPLVVP